MIIKPEFQKLIPALKPEEYSQLEASIKTEGCRDSLVLWGEILIDGHNRYEICLKHGIPFKTVQKEFSSESDAVVWIILNQFGRRNLSLYERSLLALKLEEALKPVFQEKAKENQIARKGNQHGTTSKNSVNLSPVDTQKEIAKASQVSHDTISKVKTIQAKATPEQKEKLSSGEESINKVFNEIKRSDNKLEYQERVKTEALKTDKKYRIIYADPPWSYGNTRSSGNAKDHYETMSTEDICNLPIKKLSAEDSTLFLWVTSPLLEDGLKVLNAWGYAYKSSFVWDKIKHNFGFYNSVRHEFLLIGTIGSGTPDAKELVDSVVSIERTEKHSEKPEEFRALIDKLYVNGNRIELFGRKQAKGWDVWGNEA